jgi:hypothetical protein
MNGRLYYIQLVHAYTLHPPTHVCHACSVEALLTALMSRWAYNIACKQPLHASTQLYAASLDSCMSCKQHLLSEMSPSLLALSTVLLASCSGSCYL